jgi:hypothetical protein
VEDAAWDTMFAELKQYRDQYGHCKVPQGWIENRQLAGWVMTQRSRKKKGTISLEQAARLDAIGFIWGVHDTFWETMFVELTDYKQRFGHCNVPQRWPENPQLATWVGTQRSQKNLSTERKARLDALGFDWNPQANKRRAG